MVYMSLLPFSKVSQGGGNVPSTILDSLVNVQIVPGQGASRYRYVYPNGLFLDAFFVNKGGNTLIVQFHGAVDRTRTILPRFERLATLLETEYSSIIFADPTLWIDEIIQLGWYTGVPGQNVQHDIASMVESIARQFGFERIICVGASGGGFAALQVSALIPGSVSVPINPQTSIANYFVDGDRSLIGPQRYWAKNARASELPPGHPEEFFVGDWTRSMPSECSVLRRYEDPVDNEILFVININDFHFEDHWLPFLGACARGGNLTNVKVVEYSGPDGHVAPNTDVYLDALEQAVKLS